MNKLNTTYYIYKYAISYWLEGDDWKRAKSLADNIVRGFTK